MLRSSVGSSSLRFLSRVHGPTVRYHADSDDTPRAAEHRRGSSLRRDGRGCDCQHLDRARKRLLKRADSQRPVTYQTIQEEAGLQGKCCSRTVQDALRGIGVRFRAPRHKVYLTAEDAKKRLKVAKEWIKRPAPTSTTKPSLCH